MQPNQEDAAATPGMYLAIRSEDELRVVAPDVGAERVQEDELGPWLRLPDGGLELGV